MSNKSLNKVKVLIPRPVGMSDEFSDELLARGAKPILFPLIKVEAINQNELKTVCKEESFSWIIFTSRVAVKYFFETIDPKSCEAKIAVVGSSTKREVENYGLKVNFSPSAATAKKLVKEIPLNKGENVLIPRSKIAGQGVIETLQKRGMIVKELAIYNNVPVEYSKEEIESVLAENINVITFTSGSTVDNFFTLLRRYKIKLDGPHLVSIGPSTTAAAKKNNVSMTSTAEEHNVEGLLREIEKLYS